MYILDGYGISKDIMDIPCISRLTRGGWMIYMVYPRIYHVYTMYIIEVYIYMVYTRHIPSIYRK
jgi:hypothetical protein